MGLFVTIVMPQVSCQVSQVGACLCRWVLAYGSKSVDLERSSGMLHPYIVCRSGQVFSKVWMSSFTCQTLQNVLLSHLLLEVLRWGLLHCLGECSRTHCSACMFHRKLKHELAVYRCRKCRTTSSMLAIGSIAEALKSAGAEDDLQTILQVLEDKSVGFKSHEAAAGPFANMDTTMLTGLNIRMLSIIKMAQQQQQQDQGWPLST